MAAIQEDNDDACIWLFTDKTTNALGTYTAHLTVGKLDSDKPSEYHLLCSKILKKVNSQSISYINSGLNILCPGGTDDT
jgi:hypothetical protein